MKRDSMTTKTVFSLSRTLGGNPVKMVVRKKKSCQLLVVVVEHTQKALHAES
jgi:hypothetical protein